MSTRTNETACPFTAKEREYIRRELDLFFRTLPSVADGFQLRTWRGSPLAGQPKLPPALRTMVDSGLMEIRTGAPMPRAYFTEKASAHYGALPLTGATWTRTNLRMSEQSLACRARTMLPRQPTWNRSCVDLNRRREGGT